MLTATVCTSTTLFRSIGERAHVRTLKALGHVQLLGRRIRPDDPLLLVEADGVDHERVAVPAADGVTEIRRAQVVTARMRAAEIGRASCRGRVGRDGGG